MTTLPPGAYMVSVRVTAKYTEILRQINEQP